LGLKEADKLGVEFGDGHIVEIFCSGDIWGSQKID
jgi:hypothetical protein